MKDLAAVLKNEYEKAYKINSDISEYLPILNSKANECTSVTEFGVRYGFSTRAFLNSNVKLRSYDIEFNNDVNNLFNYVKSFGKDVEYIIDDVLKVRIEETDLLFIDTYHIYNQLLRELNIHERKVKKYIIIHDTSTSTFGLVGQDGRLGLLPAIDHFLKNNSNWSISESYENNNGLTILKRVNTVFDPLLSYIQNPLDPINNFELAKYYDNINQTSAAISFYLRTAERSIDDSLKYECLLEIATSFDQQGDRLGTVESMILKAISLLPKRPEAYYLLCTNYEKTKKWEQCYTIANIALSLDNFKSQIDGLNCEKYVFIFMKALSAYWSGKFEEAKRLYFYLSLLDNIDSVYSESVALNILNLGFPNSLKYNKYFMLDKFKYYFKDIEKIEENYSETFQDMFVLSVLKGKCNGSYLEFGCNHFQKNNNTYLLETLFNWKGISIDIDCELIDLFNKNRNNLAFCEDALTIDYKELIKNNFKNKEIDYLQIDCDPPEVSFEILKKVLETDYRFNVITFEHDFYYNNKIRDPSRELLKNKGYFLLVSDVCCFKTELSYEDWWINIDYRSEYMIRNNQKNDVINYFLN